MNIIICENLKDLRRNKRNTQEELAEFLGISIQAVSKWERGEGYPDITLLPRIAAYYNITVDDLLGVGEINKQERIRQILKQKKQNDQNGYTNANVELMRNALKEFPNNYQIIAGLMFSLYLSDKDNQEYLNEVSKLGERILSECSEDEIRYDALQLLCFSYSRVGNYDKATEYAQKLPGYSVTRNEVFNSILKGEELLAHTQYNIMALVNDININVNWMLRAKEFTDDEKIHAYLTVIKFYEVLFEDGDFGHYHSSLNTIYGSIAKIYAKLNNLEKTMEYLTLSAKHAIIYDTMEDHRLTAPLVNATEYKRSDITQTWVGTHSKWLFDDFAEESFDFCREDERFKAIATNLSNYLD